MTAETPPPLLSPPPPQPLLEKPQSKSRLGLIAGVALVALVALAGWGIASRAADERALKKRTQANAILNVSAIPAAQGAVTEDVVLPGTVEAWHSAIIYARTTGYIKSWNVDIGAHVKKGDVLAEIDAPDLDAQFHQAQADLNTAIANNTIAQITAKRYADLRKTDSISQQQADQAVATAAADLATVESQKANLDHLQQQEDFKQVVAPFDGVITARNTDLGALVNGGNAGTGTGQNLFQISETDKLRVYAQVPASYAASVKPDMQAELHIPEHPHQTFPATLTRTADAIDPTTRTLTIQLEVDNADGALLAGGYTDVHLKIPSANQTVTLPVNTLIFRDGMQAAVVINNHVSLKHVTIGRDYGKTVEIVDGLSPGDTVVINPMDSIEDGQEVRIVEPKDAGQDSGKPDQGSSK